MHFVLRENYFGVGASVTKSVDEVVELVQAPSILYAVA